MNLQSAYKWLKEQSLETNYLLSVAEILAWDQRTFIPKNGHGHRAEQMTVMAKLLHERSTDSKIGECLSILEKDDHLADPLSTIAINYREWKRDYEKSIKIPTQLAINLTKAATEGESIWEQTRQSGDWATFAPYMEKLLDLSIQKAEALGYQNEPYDALIDDFEPGETAQSLEHTFGGFKNRLVKLIGDVKKSDINPNIKMLTQKFETDAQERFSKYITKAIGYDLDSGRIDVAAHPFTIGIGPGDVRITTRYHENLFGSSVFGSLHEAGHAIYEQGLSHEHWGTPVGQVASLGIHESQSRMWENMVGRSKGFWKFAFTKAQSEFKALASENLDDFLLAINAVEPSLIRVEADELTYNLHIFIRFELELALVRGKLRVADLPEAWNEKMKSYLGLEPDCIANGAMQDVHWSAGMFGYFPTYTLGNLYAAQMFAKIKDEVGDLDEMFALGNFDILRNWLNEKVHSSGKTWCAKDLILRITGEKLTSSHFMDYCENKYRKLYNL